MSTLLRRTICFIFIKIYVFGLLYFYGPARGARNVRFLLRCTYKWMSESWRVRFFFSYMFKFMVAALIIRLNFDKE